MGIFASTRSQDEGVQLVHREPMAIGEVSYRLNPRMGSHRLRDLHDVRKHGSYCGVILQVIQASWRARELDPRRRVGGVEHVVRVPDEVGVLTSVARLPRGSGVHLITLPEVRNAPGIWGLLIPVHVRDRVRALVHVPAGNSRRPEITSIVRTAIHPNQ